MAADDHSKRTINRKTYWAALLYLLVLALMAVLAYYNVREPPLVPLDPSLAPNLAASQPWQSVFSTLGIALVSLIASLPIFFIWTQGLRESNAELALIVEEYDRDMDRLPSLDVLTSQYNRPGFERLLDSELVRCRRHGLDCAIAVLKIDGFADLRSARGQSAANAVLIQCAARLASAIRGCDLIGRLDDQRFGLILPQTSLEKGVIAAERIRRILAQSPMGMPDDAAEVQITASIGITSVQEADAERATLIRIAEQRLDRAAGAGNDLVIAADA
jgi:diguanylate cyclase (GGDEF)-like protein